MCPPPRAVSLSKSRKRLPKLVSEIKVLAADHSTEQPKSMATISMIAKIKGGGFAKLFNSLTSFLRLGLCYGCYAVLDGSSGRDSALLLLSFFSAFSKAFTAVLSHGQCNTPSRSGIQKSPVWLGNFVHRACCRRSSALLYGPGRAHPGPGSWTTPCTSACRVLQALS